MTDEDASDMWDGLQDNTVAPFQILKLIEVKQKKRSIYKNSAFFKL